MYRYMISFSYEAPSGIGFMGIEWPCKRPIRSMDDVTVVMNHLRNSGYVNAVILGFSLFADPAPKAAS
ncbi:hypothetical protein [Micromonospora aurantiaca (nom. illeg.)]|uniref:Uncharacterized protein n=1 Tax=Micromonospora aurantiaca (nom. illeg.) TaxID=47850 RepID=A0A6N3JVA7_9ACTN|nr:hypothetical protein [Micromonospora aurantiaca]AXH89292.1 hypothetical protein DVH21_04735 [Micromonospora aurantiaca]